jgi:hypothetical protein
VKTIGKALLGITLLLALGFLWLLWDVGMPGDWGLESGYYGHFNRAKHVIEDMPDVAIVDSWQHQDLSLEDFRFLLRVEGTQEVTVSFSENSPQMGERNKERLREFIQREIDANQAAEATWEPPQNWCGDIPTRTCRKR